MATSAAAISRKLYAKGFQIGQTGYDTYGVFVHGRGAVTVTVALPKPYQAQTVTRSIAKFLMEQGYSVKPWGNSGANLTVTKD
jgi:hypothetical protein